MIIKTVRGKTPVIDSSVFIAENATIIGDVQIGKNSSVWYNVVIRGDVNYIRIGENTNIQDGTVIHATYQKFPTIIGNDVTIGHSAVIHACTIEDMVLVGMGAIVMDDAKVHSGAIIAAGSVVLPGTVVEPYSLYAGVPAKKIKELDPQKAREDILAYAKKYLMYSQLYQDPEN